MMAGIIGLLVVTFLGTVGLCAGLWATKSFFRLDARFPELARVRVIGPRQPPNEGYVVASLFRDGRWLYKVSIADADAPGETFDNWYAESALCHG